MMKNKIIAGIVSLAIVGVASYSLTSKVAEQTYVPRDESGFDTQGWNGAAELYKMLRANIHTGKFEVEDVLAARKEVAERSATGSRASLDLSWKEQGPDNVGGRTRALLIDKDNNQKLITGGVSGGLFVSYNAAATWTRIQSFDDVADHLSFSPAISTIAQAPNGDIYVGTGASFETTSGSGDSGMMGRGIFKSTDGGATWTVLENAHPGAGNNSTAAEWIYVNRIAIDQNNGYIYAAMNKGLRRSTDGGDTWENVVTIPGTNCLENTGTGQDVKITSDGVVVAVISGNIYRSETGEPCEFDKIGVVAGARTSIAVSRGNEDYWYAVSVDGSGELRYLYKSTDKALNWEILQAPIAGYFGSDAGLFNGQGFYDLAIGANPFNENDVIIGGVQLWRHDGNLRRIAAEFPGEIAGGGYQYLVHSDKHDIIFDETDQNIVYVVSDGGVTKSIDGGNTWFEANKGYNVTQFYSVAYDSDGKMMAGSQDNGTQEVTGEGFFPKSADEVSGGDGFDCDYSQITDVRFASVYSEEVKRGIDGAGFGAICNGPDPATGNATNTQGPDCGSGTFYTKLRIWESKNDPTSQATVAFENVNAPVGIKKGDGTTRKFSVDLNHPQSGGQFVKGGFKVYVGTVGTSSYQEVTDSVISSTAGVFVGAGGSTGTVNYTTGEVVVTFGSAPTETQTVWAEFESMYPIGTTLALNSNTGTSNTQIPLDYKLPANLNPGETVLVNDPVQSILVANDGTTVAITREALDLSKTPDWWRVLGMSSTAFALEFSTDGDNLFVGTYSGTLFRVSNLNQVYSKADLDALATVKQIGSFGQVVTGIAIDPNDANNVVVTLAGYGGTNYVYKSSNALATTPTFTNATGDLPKMPCYDAIIDVNDGNKVVIGTEYGVWATDDIWATSVAWTDESGELGNVPVFAVRQQTQPWDVSHNRGEIYLGTHARGMWRSGSLVGTNDFEEIVSDNNKFVNSLNVYPNPMSETGYVSFNLDRTASGKITIMDINGRVVKTITNKTFNAGDNNVQLDVNDYEKGTYIVTLNVEGEKKISKFIVM